MCKKSSFCLLAFGVKKTADFQQFSCRARANTVIVSLDVNYVLCVYVQISGHEKKLSAKIKGS